MLPVGNDVLSPVQILYKKFINVADKCRFMCIFIKPKCRYCPLL